MSKLNVCLELSAEEAGECSRFEMENFYQKILRQQSLRRNITS